MSTISLPGWARRRIDAFSSDHTLPDQTRRRDFSAEQVSEAKPIYQSGFDEFLALDGSDIDCNPAPGAVCLLRQQGTVTAEYQGDIREGTVLVTMAAEGGTQTPDPPSDWVLDMLEPGSVAYARFSLAHSDILIMTPRNDGFEVFATHLGPDGGFGLETYD